ncbi:SAM-dependent methyltransferase [Salinibacter ruber]|uniref:SAM-dependent methyltransferase n=1 Tax=Salinibacter ruber TaxID=146919 RepID=UPI002169F752|nr:class I SAM-dependent methyltransferase [Salinibacter ruber]MCS3860902.1 SAM-dependent methyltransferase [Salinibacter ruber]
MRPASPLARTLVVPLLVCSLVGAEHLPLAGCAQNPDPSSTRGPDTSAVQGPAPATSPSIVDSTVDADVPFVVSPEKTVEGMLELAGVTESDTVYDLGSGDGRVPIAAAKQHGARGVGIEIKPDLVQRARKRAKLAGVSDRVEFRRQDLFEADFSDATVVTMYLFPEVNLRLRPMLFEQLDPGTRVVSHSFDMNGWEPDSTVTVDGDVLYLWTIPDEIPAHLQE